MIRPEQSTDVDSIGAILCAAFPTDAEAKLVGSLRSGGHLLVSLVASAADKAIGHVAFSPVTIQGNSLIGGGLAPVAIHPSHQRHGWGQRLIHAGLDACRAAGIDYVVVLGDPAYYQRFGFTPASDFRLDNEYDAGDAFMARELTPGCLAHVAGLVRYGDEFRALA